MRTVRMQAKQGETLEGFIERAIKVAIAAEQPILAIHGTTEFTVCPTHKSQVLDCVSLIRKAKPEGTETSAS